jgi:hypothetical protein
MGNSEIPVMMDHGLDPPRRRPPQSIPMGMKIVSLSSMIGELKIVARMEQILYNAAPDSGLDYQQRL